MKLTRAALLEPSAARWKQIALGLTKAGLKVSAARTADGLRSEQLVVLGPGLPDPKKVAGQVRGRLAQAVLLAAQAKGFRAVYADAVLPLPISPNDLKVRLDELAPKAAALRPARPGRKPASDASAESPPTGEPVIDPLTGFYTFSHFKELLYAELKRSRRHGFPLALALASFDPIGGKQAEALHVQLMGGLAIAVRRSVRDTDFPVRYGAEKVLVLMPHTDLAGALTVGQRICDKVAGATLLHDEEALHPSISVGVAGGVLGKGITFAELARKAQFALHRAEEKGGNQVEFFSSGDEEESLAAVPSRS